MKVAITALEYYLPQSVEDNAALAVDNPDWPMAAIEEKIGIKSRHVAAAEETAADMAVSAAEKLFAGGVDKETVDFVILVTQSPDYALPTSACLVQDRLGLKKNCMAFDVNLGCSGFVYGLGLGGSMIESGLASGGLVVCSETYTKYIDPHDRTCRPVFGDGAAAVVLAASSRDALGPFEMGSDGSGGGSLMVADSGARRGEAPASQPVLFMDGAKVLMFTMDKVPQCMEAVLQKSEKTLDDIDYFIFHQASRLVVDNIVRRMELPEEKVFRNYENIGNTVSAALPVALKDAVAAKKISDGDLVMLVGFGVGYSWGACLVEWGGGP